MSPAGKSLEGSDARFALSIVAGLVLFNVIIFILPLIYAAWISFHDRDVILRTQEFIGLDHYRRILTSPEAIAAILLSLKFTAVVVAAYEVLLQHFAGVSVGAMASTVILIGLGCSWCGRRDHCGRRPEGKTVH